jgi:hypothetical protein
MKIQNQRLRIIGYRLLAHAGKVMQVKDVEARVKETYGALGSLGVHIQVPNVWILSQSSMTYLHAIAFFFEGSHVQTIRL